MGRVWRIVNWIILSRVYPDPRRRCRGPTYGAGKRDKIAGRIHGKRGQDNERERETEPSTRALGTGLLDHDDSKRSPASMRNARSIWLFLTSPTRGLIPVIVVVLLVLSAPPPPPPPSALSPASLVAVVVVVGDKRDSSRRSARSTTMSYRSEGKWRATRKSG